MDPHKPFRIVRIVLLTLVFAGPGLLAAHGFLHERIAEIDALIADDPTAAEPYLRRAELHREHGDFARALADIDKARELEPGLARVDLQLGRLYLDQGRVDAARDAAERFLSRAPEGPQTRALVSRAHRLLAEIERQAGDDASAARHLGMAIAATERPSPALFIEHADALQRAGAEHALEAIKTLEAGMRRLGALSVLQERALELELARQDYPAALSRVEAMVAATPENPLLLVRKGQILEKAGRSQQALEAYRVALRALDRSPSPRRESPAARRLRSEIEQALERLSSSSDSATLPLPH